MKAYLPPEYKDKLSPSYRRNLKKLEEEFSATVDFKERQQLLDSFSEEFLMPRQLWDELICLYFFNTRDGYDRVSKDNLEKLRQRALYQFYYDKNGKFRDHIRLYLFFQVEHRKLLKMDANFDEYHTLGLPYLKMKEKQLTYPHQALNEVFQFYERYYTSTPSTELVKRYREMKKLYAKIVAVEDNLEQWLEKLKEVGDDQFVIHNLEYRLGGNLCDLKLWELYIEFLREYDPKEMLQAYSKYCRFFVDDQKMLEKYKQETTVYGPINVCWKNRFDFEARELQEKEPTFDLFDEGFQRTERISWIQKQPCQIFFNGNDYILQNFSLPNTIIHYIHQSANHIVLQKLYKSCKYFFVKKSLPICYKFDYTCSPRVQRIAYTDQSIDIRMDQNGILNLNNLFIANSLSFYYLPEIKYQTLSTIIQSFARCEPKHLTIENQNLKMDEYNFLAGHGNIETLHFKNVRITDGNGDIVPVEDIVAKLPKVYELCLDNVYCTPQTSISLLQISFTYKLKQLKLLDINDKLELDDFFTFLFKNIHQKSNCTFSCCEEASESFILEFQRQRCCLMDLEFSDAKKRKPGINIFSAAEYELYVLN